MVRQARSEATRQKIIDSAVDLINEIGYPAAGLADIIERAEMTKGALYYHFDSKEALASAIMDDGGARVLAAFQAAGRTGSPALENIIHGVFMVTDTIHRDKLAQASSRLMRTFGGFNAAAKGAYGGFLAEMTSRVKAAVGEGDVRADVDSDVIGRAIFGAMLGAELLSDALDSSADTGKQVVGTWEVLLLAIVQADSLNYYLEFLSRQASRASTSRHEDP
ncbi:MULTISPECIES: TetR/AcrR family transcriptional regulator [unclassified Mycobacterium]|uniref:TetR/AcrR family transcriptional regulator n=1 Tax=unclassified Mycobacterium TaxID=2642494 RepID=UPI0029C7497A|nr:MULTISPECIES: TetR/AcrR family transcriptional regulator [unclassified Mycobacterium]